MFLTKVVEKIKTCILCSIILLKSHAIYEIIWKNTVELDRPQMKCGACTLHAGYLGSNTHLEYIVLIAFPLQQWLHVCASLLCYAYISSFIAYIFIEISAVRETNCGSSGIIH